MGLDLATNYIYIFTLIMVPNIFMIMYRLNVSSYNLWKSILKLILHIWPLIFCRKNHLESVNGYRYWTSDIIFEFKIYLFFYRKYLRGINH